MIATIMAMGSAIRNPAKMNGAAAGTTTRQRMRAREAPMLAADQSQTRFTAQLPACGLTSRCGPRAPRRAHPPQGAPGGGKRRPAGAGGRSPARRLLPGEDMAAYQEEQLIAGVAEHRDRDDGHVHQVEPQARLRLSDEKPEARAGIDHLGGEEKDERERQRDAQPGEDQRKRARDDDLAKDL